FLLRRPPPWLTLFPYTTLFRSASSLRLRGQDGVAPCVAPDVFDMTFGLQQFAPDVPVAQHGLAVAGREREAKQGGERERRLVGRDRKSTRLNSSHVKISYAVFC